MYIGMCITDTRAYGLSQRAENTFPHNTPKTMKNSCLAIASVLRSTVGQEVDPAAISAAKQCNSGHPTLKFIYLDSEAQDAAVEDSIRRDLAAIGLRVEGSALSKDEINVARQAGDFHFSLSESWGTPYDPWSTAGGWIDGKGGEGVFEAMVNFSEGYSREALFDMIKDVQQEENVKEQNRKWGEIHQYYHRQVRLFAPVLSRSYCTRIETLLPPTNIPQQAVLFPLWGKRIPTLMNSRLTGYEAGYQQYDYPVHRLLPVSGSTTVKIAPGARTGLFKTVGAVDAHTYGPNEFFSNNWIYEGLVAYGQGGQILPSLASKWSIKENTIGGDDYTFTLRQNVTFHDGTAWDCAAAKLNFDHVLAGALRDTHGWYGIPLVTKKW
jgi:ABC-type transport system substrate-binding protein